MTGDSRTHWGMTLRELLKALQAVDEKFLDMEVLVSPPSGGYGPVSHTSLLHIGHPVIHLAETQTEAVAGSLQDGWFGSDDPVPAVDPADLRNVWSIFQNSQAACDSASGRCGSIDVRSYERMCNPGADVMAVWYRASMLALLKVHLLPESAVFQGDFADKVFQVAAGFPMKRMGVGVVHQGPPFDVQEFVRQIQQA